MSARARARARARVRGRARGGTRVRFRGRSRARPRPRARSRTRVRVRVRVRVILWGRSPLQKSLPKPPRKEASSSPSQRCSAAAGASAPSFGCVLG